MHGENLLPPLRFYVQERHPDQATSPASNVLVDDHTLHQPCVQSLSFKSRLALWMPAH